MKHRHGFVSGTAEPLEDRIVLSHSHIGRGLSVVVSGLHPNQQVLNRHQQSIVAEVNQAFDLFESDYSQARATFFAALGNAGAASDARTAFQPYTVQRVSLLAEQVISSFLQYPQGAARTPGQPSTLNILVMNQIINPQKAGSTPGVPAGLLINSLVYSIPPSTESAPQSLALYSLSQDNAIEAARVTVINGVNIVRNGDFGNKVSHTHP
jgi:hypothetical protein